MSTEPVDAAFNRPVMEVAVAVTAVVEPILPAWIRLLSKGPVGTVNAELAGIKSTAVFIPTEIVYPAIRPPVKATVGLRTTALTTDFAEIVAIVIVLVNPAVEKSENVLVIFTQTGLFARLGIEGLPVKSA